MSGRNQEIGNRKAPPTTSHFLQANSFLESMRIYILGANGFLGSQFVEYTRDKDYDVLTERIDITDFVGLSRIFKEKKPDVVINFAGVKAYPTIDWCEDHKEETVKVNVAGAINTMIAAIESGAYPIQISSGCVYSGGPEHEFTEEDEPNFYGSFYSRMRIVLQKALAELSVLYARIRMPVLSISHPRNLITKLASYQQVISVPNSVTLIEDLWPALEHIIKIRPVGILNLTNEGRIEHKQILEAYKKIVNPEHDYELITQDYLEQNITKARRSNCVLSTDKAKSLGIKMPALTDKRLEEIMEKYKEAVSF